MFSSPLVLHQPLVCDWVECWTRQHLQCGERRPAECRQCRQQLCKGAKVQVRTVRCCSFGQALDSGCVAVLSKRLVCGASTPFQHVHIHTPTYPPLSPSLSLSLSLSLPLSPSLPPSLSLFQRGFPYWPAQVLSADGPPLEVSSAVGSPQRVAPEPAPDSLASLLPNGLQVHVQVKQSPTSKTSPLSQYLPKMPHAIFPVYVSPE